MGAIEWLSGPSLAQFLMVPILMDSFPFFSLFIDVFCLERRVEEEIFASVFPPFLFSVNGVNFPRLLYYERNL